MLIADMPLTFRICAGIEHVSVLFCEDIYTDSVSSEKATEVTGMDQTARDRSMRREEKLKCSPWGIGDRYSAPYGERMTGRTQLSKLWNKMGENALWVSAVKKQAVNYSLMEHKS